jgi:AcrR family transcriptional regulator
MPDARPPDRRILDAAYHLLSTGGRDAVTTRAVSAQANVQPQTIYRHFGDMAGLLDAVAARGFAEFVSAKPPPDPAADPVEQLRAGWDTHIAFAASRPAVYALMYAEPRAETSDGARRVYQMLRSLVADVAAAGRLAIPVDTAATMVYAAGIGVALAQLTGIGGDVPDESVSSGTREAILDAILRAPVRGRGGDDLAWHATSMRALIAQQASPFSDAETGLLDEWLSRLEEP